MNESLYGRSHFIDGIKGDRAYEEYLEMIRKGKNYKFYKRLADLVWSLAPDDVCDDVCLDENLVLSYNLIVMDLLNLVDTEMNERYAYHYEWYAVDARRAIELVLMETERRV